MRGRNPIMAVSEQDIRTGLGDIIEDIAGVPAAEVTPEKSFVDDLDIDSLSMVEIAVAAQDQFGVEIPDDELKNLTTVKDVIDYVQGKGVSEIGRASCRERVWISVVAVSLKKNRTHPEEPIGNS